MLETRPARDIVKAIHRAALDATAWPVVLRSLEDLFDESPMALHCIDTRMKSTSIVGIGRFDPDFSSSYVDYYVGLSPWPSKILKTPFGRPRNFGNDFPSEFYKSEFYHDWVLPQDDLRGGSGLRTRSVGGKSLFFGVNMRARSLDKYQPAALRWLEVLEPHLSHAFAVNEALATLMAERSLNGLDRTQGGSPPQAPKGALLLDGNRRVLWMDPAAPRLFGSILHLDAAGRASFLNSVAQDWLEGVMTLIDGDDDLVTQRLELRSRLIGADWLLRAVPCRNGLEPSKGPSRLGFPAGYASPCLVLVLFPADSRSSPEARLRDRFGLSAVEAEIAMAIASGTGTRQLAEQRGVTINTVRNQIQSILAKTGTHSRGEIMRLISSLAPKPSMH